MTLPLTIRGAEVEDAVALREIYRPYVETTAISFELDVPTASDFAGRIEAALQKWSWLVAELGGRPVGYAYGSAHRGRAAYAYSVETSAYVEQGHHRRGVARALYTELFAQLQRLGYASAYAGITMPNEASVSFHKSFGFQPIGVFPRVGYKFGRWHDVAWLYRPIRPTDADDGDSA